MKLNKVNRRTSPDSALRDYIAQLHIIGRQMRMRTSGVVLTASPPRAVASLYVWLQLHLFSKLFLPEYSTLHPWLPHKTRAPLQVAHQRMTLPAPVSRPLRNDCPHLKRPSSPRIPQQSMLLLIQAPPRVFNLVCIQCSYHCLLMQRFIQPLS